MSGSTIYTVITGRGGVVSAGVAVTLHLSQPCLSSRAAFESLPFSVSSGLFSQYYALHILFRATHPSPVNSQSILSLFSSPVFTVIIWFCRIRSYSFSFEESLLLNYRWILWGWLWWEGGGVDKCLCRHFFVACCLLNEMFEKLSFVCAELQPKFSFLEFRVLFLLITNNLLSRVQLC